MTLTGSLLLSFILHTYGSSTPNIGDVRLLNVHSANDYGEAQMYLTDGSSPAIWSSICKTKTFDIDAAKLFCKQLGYSYNINRTISARKSSSPILISDIDCEKGKTYRNLLECSYHLEKQNCSGVVFLSCYKHNSRSSTPNIGDVRLHNVQSANDYGEAQMYLTDGSSPAIWSSICKSKTFDIGEAKLFCKQLGYSYNINRTISARKSSSSPILISDIDCEKGKTYRNLLECSYHLENQSCSYVVFLSCYKHNSRTTQDGQLQICSPDSTEVTNDITSKSFGIIGISFNEHWRAIGNATISQGASYLADLMCISLGFQKAVSGSIKTAQAVEQYTFSACQERYQRHSWIYLTDLVSNCNVETQHPCLGCCLEYPSEPACGGGLHCVNDFIVIQCMFDLFEKDRKITSNEGACVFSENSQEGDKIQNYSSICKSNFEHLGETVLGVLFALFFITTVIFIVSNITYCVYKCGKCKRYVPLPNGREEGGVPNGHDLSDEQIK